MALLALVGVCRVSCCEPCYCVVVCSHCEPSGADNMCVCTVECNNIFVRMVPLLSVQYHTNQFSPSKSKVYLNVVRG